MRTIWFRYSIYLIHFNFHNKIVLLYLCFIVRLRKIENYFREKDNDPYDSTEIQVINTQDIMKQIIVIPYQY